MDYFLCVMGMVLIVEGLPYLAFPDRIKSYLRKLTAIPDTTLRIMGSMAVIIGLLLVYFGRS
ncbi:MAG: DUF2065 domain-containing protein [Syntrophales bacterium]